MTHTPTENTAPVSVSQTADGCVRDPTPLPLVYCGVMVMRPLNPKGVRL
jgi:hypothetical protein